MELGHKRAVNVGLTEQVEPLPSSDLRLPLYVPNQAVVNHSPGLYYVWTPAYLNLGCPQGEFAVSVVVELFAYSRLVNAGPYRVDRGPGFYSRPKIIPG